VQTSSLSSPVRAASRKEAKLTETFVLSARPKTKDAGESYEKRYPITISPAE
jgi:hypothetical protein